MKDRQHLIGTCTLLNMANHRMEFRAITATRELVIGRSRIPERRDPKSGPLGGAGRWGVIFDLTVKRTAVMLTSHIGV